MSSPITKIRTMISSLLPTGRAFRVNKDTSNDHIINGISTEFTTLRNELISILNIVLPDNNYFTAADATRWEQLLGMIVNPATSLTDRKLAILRKMSHPGGILARQSRDYIEGQLQGAGFDVYVYENIPQQYPGIVFGASINGIAVHSDDVKHGAVVHGDNWLWHDVVANRIDWTKDQYFNTTNDLSTTFFICGPTLGSLASIPATRRNEFRQLILKLKPVKTTAFLGINYI